MIQEGIQKALAGAAVRATPYRHLLPQDCLPEQTARAIAGLPFAVPRGLAFAGRREVNNSTRIYFNPPNRREFPVVEAMAEAFDRAAVRAALAQAAQCDLRDSLLRIEYCQDTDGFWLEPHTDIAVKKLTFLIYLSEDPSLADAGTDIYHGPPDFQHAGTAPYVFNAGFIFAPGQNTWHGVAPRKINGVRKSVIINYVGQDWRERWELCAG